MNPPTPYYSDESVTLYHGDCLEITDWLEADVLVTDPPYGMAYESNRNRDKRNVKIGRPVASDTDTAIRDAALDLWGDRAALVFGTWRSERPARTRQVLIWDKSHNGPGMGATTLPWGPSHEDIYVLGSGFTGKRETSVLTVTPYNSQSANRPRHPTPKPEGLMALLLAKTVGVVADPFAGSGSTLVAARNLGRRAVGVELEEQYCEVIANRLSQVVLDFGEVGK